LAVPFLILAIASFVTFFAIVFLLGLADALESREVRHNVSRCPAASPEEAPPYLSIPQAFDPVFAVLWDAPVDALKLVDSGGASGIPVSRLRPIVSQAATRFPEFYDGCSFAQWVKFLEDMQLIAWNGQRVSLTAGGQHFLAYRFVSEALAEA
jgi:hypothetical protein